MPLKEERQELEEKQWYKKHDFITEEKLSSQTEKSFSQKRGEEARRSKRSFTCQQCVESCSLQHKTLKST